MRSSSIILASASPRRRKLLMEAGYDVEVDPSEIDEPEPTEPIDARVYTAQLALRKALTVAHRRARGLVLAADTACFIDGAILNKPNDRADALRMIRLQEGRDTEVITSVVLVRAEHDEWTGASETSVVRMRQLTDRERDAYLDSGDWRGKAGAYGVQDNDPLIRVVSGSWSNVVGLPMERLEELLSAEATRRGRGENVP